MPRDKPAGRLIAFDIAASKRHKDENGYMHVERSNLTKEQIAPYYGEEIGGWQELGLNPGTVYYMYRPAEELKRAADTFNGLPLLFEHHDISADNIPKDKVIGSLGTDAEFDAPYLANSLIITDAEAIAAIESGEYRELSAAYMYEAEMEPGMFDGQHYDGKMRNIRGNHVAIVREGRAGPDVAVADSGSKIKNEAGKAPAKKEATAVMKQLMQKLKRLIALDAVPAIEELEVNLAQFMRAVQVIEAQREGIAPSDIGIEIAPDATPEGVVDLFFPDADEDVKEALADQLRALKEAPSVGDKEPAAPAAEPAAEPAAGEPKQPAAPAEGAKDEDKPVVEIAEELKEAMDACGIDAGDPAKAEAFAAGVKYGEELFRSKAEREKLDREHEAEGMKKELEEKLDDAVKKAQDSMKQHYKAVAQAAQDCAPLIGTLKDPLAFDSAAAIYRKALEANGINVAGVSETAYAAMVGMLKRGMTVTAPKFAQDGAEKDGALTKALSGLDRITIA